MKYLVRGCNKAISADLVHNEEIESPDVVKQKEEDTRLARHRARRLQQCYSSCAINPISGGKNDQVQKNSTLQNYYFITEDI